MGRYTENKKNTGTSRQRILQSLLSLFDSHHDFTFVLCRFNFKLFPKFDFLKFVSKVLIFPMRSPKKTMPSMSPSSISTEKSPPPSDTSMAIVAFDNSTTHLSSSPSPPHSLDHSSDSEKEDEKRRPESRRNKNPVKIEETPSPIVVVHNHNRSVKEVVPTRKTARVGSGRSSGQRSGAVLAILRRSRREEIVKFSALGFRLSEVVLALISFSIMAADKTKGWSGDSFDRYKEYRYNFVVFVLLFSSQMVMFLEFGFSI